MQDLGHHRKAVFYYHEITKLPNLCWPHPCLFQKNNDMEKYFFLLCLAILSATACKKSCTTPGEALLIGIDYRKCASPYCGGWFIEINNDTLRFFETPEKTDIDFNSELEFPIPVDVEWERYDNDWKDVPDLIRVEKIFTK